MIAATVSSPHRFPTTPDPATTIPELVARRTARRPGDIAVIDGTTRLTAAELLRASERAAAALARAGVGRGDVVVLQLPNRWQTIAAMQGVWLLGGIATPVTPIYRTGELTRIFADASPRAVVVPGEHRGHDYAAQARAALAAAGAAAPVLTAEGLTAEGLTAEGILDARPEAAPSAHDRAPASPDDVAMLMFTSGTTGRAKGVLHSHRTLLHESASLARLFGLERDAVFMPSPLTHVTGLLYGVLLPLLVDGSVVLQDRWDPASAVEAIERHGCTFTVAATPFLRGLADAYAERPGSSRLRVFVCGGADIPPELVRRATAILGAEVARTYGSTEMPTLAIVPSELPAPERWESEGRVIGAARGRLADAVDGVGELEVIGPELFVGYLDPADNEPAFTADGWFRTGDLARLDDGLLRIAGRSKDLIIRGGENISSKEIEDVLLSEPAIADVAVVAIPDDTMGERACAVVVPAPGSRAPALAELAGLLDAAGLAAQKRPEALLLVDELPRTPSGKIQKFLVRERVRDALAEGRVERR
ncbi:AMP-binding protein [Leucobacter allii]|uniref:AMP-binding protein n=1 Tax=Leucobacter allii TaxID=2932247 RepID=UPI001FD3CBFF|nr:AMP-binding protein [Leucobacter allii]UOR01317.1 AMP-binding protein [Leucobacter allii]